MNSSLRSSEVNLDLSRFDTTVQNETKPRKQFAEVPDGRYDARIDDVELYTSPASGNPVLKYTLRILGPTNTGRILLKYRGITERTVSYVLDELRICGLELERFSDLKNRLQELIGVELEVTRKTRGSDVNIYFNESRDSFQPSKQEEDDELPF